MIKISKDVLAYCFRAVVRYLDGNYELFKHYRDTAMQLYYEEIGIPWDRYVTQKKRHLYVPIRELIQK